MKRYAYSDGDHYDKQRIQERNRERKARGFTCNHCRQFIPVTDFMGTANRNHCNICLWSKHVDENTGDRRAICKSGMEPVGLTFKYEGRGKAGEIMVVHVCRACQKVSINRIARDDVEHSILEVFYRSFSLGDSMRLRLGRRGIDLLGRDDEEEVSIRLFGKP
jgi:hypothetical protein